MDRNCRELVRGGRSHFFALCRGGRSHFGGFWIRSLLGSTQYSLLCCACAVLLLYCLCLCLCLYLCLCLCWLELSYLCFSYPLNLVPGYGHGANITHSNLNHSLQYSTVWIRLWSVMHVGTVLDITESSAFFYKAQFKRPSIPSWQPVCLTPGPAWRKLFLTIISIIITISYSLTSIAGALVVTTV